MTTGDAIELDRLPAHCGELARAFLEAASTLAWRSLLPATDASPTAEALLLLRSLVLHLRVYLGRQNDRLVSFFWKKDRAEQLLLDAEIRFRISAVPQPPPIHEPRPATRFRVEVPACFLPCVSGEERRRLLKLAGGAPADTLLLRFEHGAIAMDTRTRRIAWSREARSLAPGDSGYLWPLLAMARSLGVWIKGASGRGAEVPVSTATLGCSDLGRLLNHLTEAREEMRQALAATPASPGLVPAYAVTASETSLTIRLDESGNLAFDDQEDLFQLAATLTCHDEDGAPLAILCARPPDFLLSGPVFDALLDQWETGDAAAALAGALAPLLASDPVRRGLPRNTTPAAAVRDFVRSARNDCSATYAALIFRIRRGRQSSGSPDTDLFVFNGRLGGIAQVHLVVKAQVHVRPATESTPLGVSIVNASVRLLACSHLETGEPLDEMTGYFIRLFRQLRRWYGVTAL